jgi:hypothetical protein
MSAKKSILPLMTHPSLDLLDSLRLLNPVCRQVEPREALDAVVGLS